MKLLCEADICVYVCREGSKVSHYIINSKTSVCEVCNVQPVCEAIM